MTFVGRAFEELHPGKEFHKAPHLEVMCARLSATLRGEGSKRLIINLPPRSLKSMTVSVASVAWALGLDPARKIVCASYGQILSDSLGSDTRQLMGSPFYRQVFPYTRLSPTQRAVSDFATIQGGFRLATSAGGPLTGRGGDIVIVDDPSKVDEVPSDSSRGAVNDWYDTTLLSRLDDKEKGIIILVMQRLHQDDLVGTCLTAAKT